MSLSRKKNIGTPTDDGSIEFSTHPVLVMNDIGEGIPFQHLSLLSICT